MEYRAGSALISGSAVLSRNGLPYWVSPLCPGLCKGSLKAALNQINYIV